jgi:hypothetical protein
VGGGSVCERHPVQSAVGDALASGLAFSSTRPAATRRAADRRVGQVGQQLLITCPPRPDPTPLFIRSLEHLGSRNRRRSRAGPSRTLPTTRSRPSPFSSLLSPLSAQRLG